MAGALRHRGRLRRSTLGPGDDHVFSDFRGPPQQGELGRLFRQRQDAPPRAGAGRGLRRQHPLQEPDARGVDPVAVELAGREVARPLAHPHAPPRSPAEGPRRNPRRLPPARRPDHCRQPGPEAATPSRSSASTRPRSARGRQSRSSTQRAPRSGSRPTTRTTARSGSA